MPLFNRILDFGENEIKEVERRREPRYAPGRSYPLQATIEVDGEPRLARIIDVASGGLGLHVSGPTYTRGAPAKLHLMLEGTWIEFSCVITHIQGLSVGCRLGLMACFENFALKKTFRQMIQPVVIGSVFRPVPPEEVRQGEPGMYKQTFTGRPGTELHVWRQGETPHDPLYSFLWRMDDYLVQSATTLDEMQIFSQKCLVAKPRTKTSPAYRKLPAGLKDEIRRFFRWTMMNLPKEVPPDIHTFIQGFVR